MMTSCREDGVLQGVGQQGERDWQGHLLPGTRWPPTMSSHNQQAASPAKGSWCVPFEAAFAEMQ